MLFVLALNVVVIGGSVKYLLRQQSSRHNAAVARVRSLGGNVMPEVRELPSFKKALHAVLGEVPHRDIYAVFLRDSAFTQTAEYRANGLSVLFSFKRLRLVDAANSDIIDDDLKTLASIDSLWGIHLGGTSVTQQAIDGFLKKRPETEVILPNSKTINIRAWGSPK